MRQPSLSIWIALSLVAYFLGPGAAIGRRASPTRCTQKAPWS